MQYHRRNGVHFVNSPDELLGLLCQLTLYLFDQRASADSLTLRRLQLHR